MNQSANPLRQYFRQPSIYLPLPSQGEFWATHALDLPASGELPVLPMTAIDEITYRTPDALFNGQAVVNVIQSCMPNIKDAWECPSTDINAILTAIRIASYGHSMEIHTVCPSCGHATEYDLDLRTVLDKMIAPDFQTPIKHGDLEISFKPMSYRHQNESGQLQFEQQQMLNMLPSADIPEEEKVAKLNQVLGRITELTVEALKWSISSIRTPQAIVTNPDHFQEFLTNCDRELFGIIRKHVIDLRQSAEIKPLSMECPECSHKYEQPLTLDMTSFFGHAS